MACRFATRLIHAAAAGLPLLLIADQIALAQQDDGQIEFNNHCRTCHTVDAGDHRLGPSLHDIIGREAGSLPDYNYSDALRSSTVVWDQASLDRFIEDPDAVIRGNNMKPYSGLADPEIRGAIVGYLSRQSE